MSASLREKVFESRFEMLESRSKTIIEAEIKRRRGSSFEIVARLIRIGGATTAASPTRRRALRVLLPITKAIKTSVFPEISEANETASSGALVPNATIVRPISCLETLKLGVELVDYGLNTLE